MGHVKVSEFLAAYGVLTKKKTTRKRKADDEEANGDSSLAVDSVKTPVETMKTVLTEMLKERFLMEV
jgi:hypothetical protein